MIVKKNWSFCKVKFVLLRNRFTYSIFFCCLNFFETIQIDKPLIDSIPNNKKGPINKKDATKSEEKSWENLN